MEPYIKWLAWEVEWLAWEVELHQLDTRIYFVGPELVISNRFLHFKLKKGYFGPLQKNSKKFKDIYTFINFVNLCSFELRLLVSPLVFIVLFMHTAPKKGLEFCYVSWKIHRQEKLYDLLLFLSTEQGANKIFRSRLK